MVGGGEPVTWLERRKRVVPDHLLWVHLFLFLSFGAHSAGHS